MTGKSGEEDKNMEEKERESVGEGQKEKGALGEVCVTSGVRG